MESFLARYSAQIIVILGVISTLAIFSVLHRENAFYRLFEHIFIGLATGQGIFIAIHQILYPLWWKRMVSGGQWYWVFAFLAGMMFYFVYSKKYVWISRIIFGAFMGFEAGLAIKGFATEYVPQILASFKPIWGRGMDTWTIVNHLVFLVVLMTAMSYFFFSIDHKHASIRRVAGAGRWCLMFAFGAMFGATVGARMSLLIGRMQFLIDAVRGWLS